MLLIMPLNSVMEKESGFSRPNLSGDADDMCALRDWPSHARRNHVQIRTGKGYLQK